VCLIVWVAAPAARSEEANLPAVIKHDIERNVVVYSMVIDAPNVPANLSAKLHALRELVSNLQRQMAQITAIDDCFSAPCGSNGDCLDGLVSFVCVCAPGSTGVRCESDVNECGSSPCQNGGSCSNELGSHVCVCAPGFTGVRCESDVNECESSPCQNGGSCSNSLSGFQCSCGPVWTGLVCQTYMVTEWGCWGICEGVCGQEGVRRRISSVPVGIAETRPCESPCFPDWRNLSPEARAQSMDAMRKLLALDGCASGRLDRTTALPLPNGQTGYEESALAANGAIYFPPWGANYVLKLNPENDDMSHIGPDLGNAGDKYRGASLGPNGIVYGIPFASTSVLKIDPDVDAVSTFGSLGSGNKWIGGVVGSNGAVYGIPYSSTQVLRIDTTDNSLRLFGSISGVSKFVGGVLAPNGLIFGIPYWESSSRVLVIDPASDGISFVNTGVPAGGGKWTFAAVGLNGLVYGFPHSTSSILVVDPVTRGTTTIPATTGQIGGGMGPNGLMYLVPYATFPGVNALNTSSGVVTQRTSGSVSGYHGGVVLGPNGALYFSPSGASSILKVDFPYLPPMTLPINAVLSPFLN
jgi:hypothetical protein